MTTKIAEQDLDAAIGPIIVPIEIARAAYRLAESYGQPTSAHAVWVEASFDEEGQKSATCVICVAIHPSFKDRLKVPAEWQGFPVREKAWPLC